jgi:phosphoserine phosphatase
VVPNLYFINRRRGRLRISAVPRLGLVAFDLDGTLVRIWSAWSWIHKLLGTLEAAKPNADQYYAGQIDYIRWAELDVQLWHGVSLKRIENAIEQGLSFIPNVEPLFEKLRGYGIKTAIISSGLTVFAERVQSRLGIDICKANELVTDNAGKIFGVKVHVAFDNKNQGLSEIAQELKMPLERCVAVGDSRNDIPMFQVAGFSIAFNPANENVANAATTIVNSEDALDLLPPLVEFFKLHEV